MKKCENCGANLDASEICDCQTPKENQLIVVEQLPIIRQQLEQIKEEIKKKVSAVSAMECTEETKTEVKKFRAELSKQFAELGEKRKEVKKAIMTPYEAFEEIYKECVTNLFKQADAELKAKIDVVEQEMKQKKENEVKDYFNEYIQSKNIDFITFDNTDISITLTTSLKSLKEKAKAFVDKVVDDLALIDTQEHKEEILVEYKQTHNVSQSITSVKTRIEAIAREKELQEQAEQVKQQEAKTVEKVNEVIKPVEVQEEPKEDDKVYKMTFTVIGTKEQLKTIKNFIIEKGIKVL